MKLISWNVNGLRACLKKGFADYFRYIDADIFALQEIKMERGQAEINLDGYYDYWYSALKRGYSGTAVFTKAEPVSVKYGIGDDEHDHEGRVITLEYKDFFFVNVYTPNSQSELARLPYRMRWDDAFRLYVGSFSKPVIICGDLNCAHKEIDLTHPKANIHNAGFTIEERAKLTELLNSGFVDTFRNLYPDRRDAYSWWSFRAAARTRNVGWRIDYFLVSNSLQKSILNADIHSEIIGSDHCPVSVDMSITF